MNQSIAALMAPPPIGSFDDARRQLLELLALSRESLRILNLLGGEGVVEGRNGVERRGRYSLFLVAGSWVSRPSSRNGTPSDAPGALT